MFVVWCQSCPHKRSNRGITRGPKTEYATGQIQLNHRGGCRINHQSYQEGIYETISTTGSWASAPIYLVLDKDIISKSVAKGIGVILPGEIRWTAVAWSWAPSPWELAYKGFNKRNKLLLLPNFPCYPRSEIVCIPKTRAIPNFDGSNLKILHRTHAEVATEWTGHLPINFNGGLMIPFLANNQNSAIDKR